MSVIEYSRYVCQAASKQENGEDERKTTTVKKTHLRTQNKADTAMSLH